MSTRDRLLNREEATDRHARDLAQASPQRAIARRDDVAPVRVDPFDDAVVCVGTLVGAGETFEARVARDAVREGWRSQVSEVAGARGEGTYRSARRYFCPSFSSSAMTQSEMQGMPGAGSTVSCLGSTLPTPPLPDGWPPCTAQLSSPRVAKKGLTFCVERVHWSKGTK